MGLKAESPIGCSGPERGRDIPTRILSFAGAALVGGGAGAAVVGAGAGAEVVGAGAGTAVVGAGAGAAVVGAGGLGALVVGADVVHPTISKAQTSRAMPRINNFFTLFLP